MLAQRKLRDRIHWHWATATSVGFGNQLRYFSKHIYTDCACFADRVWTFQVWMDGREKASKQLGIASARCMHCMVYVHLVGVCSAHARRRCRAAVFAKLAGPSPAALREASCVRVVVKRSAFYALWATLHRCIDPKGQRSTFPPSHLICTRPFPPRKLLL